MEVGSYCHAINFANDKRFGLVYIDHTGLEGSISVWEERGKMGYRHHKHPQVPFYEVGM
jgi:hypothetical protein